MFLSWTKKFASSLLKTTPIHKTTFIQVYFKQILMCCMMFGRFPVSHGSPFFILHMKLNVNTQNSGEVSVLWLALVKSHHLRQVWIWNLTLPHFSAGKYSKKASCLQTHTAIKQLVRVHPTQTASWNNNSYREVCDDIRSLWMTHVVLKFFYWALAFRS